MNVTLMRHSDTALELQWSNPAASRTQISLLNPDQSEEPLCETAGEKAILEHSAFFKPTYKIRCGKVVRVISERVLPLQGANNFRDAGGYETENGLVMRWNKIYRSDHLHRLTDKDFSYLKPLEIRSVIDYRNPKEVAKQPNNLWDERIESFCFTPDASSAELAAKASNDADKISFLLDIAKSGDSRLAIDNSGKIMQEQYRDFIHHPDSVDAFRNMLLLLAERGEWASDQHCRGGKDRTGFGIALVHMVLGVKREWLYLDYMLTNVLRAERNQRRMAQYRAETDDPNVLGFLSSMMETRQSYLDAAFDEIAQRYGSVERYIKQGLGISQDVITQLQAHYLTEKGGV